MQFLCYSIYGDIYILTNTFSFSSAVDSATLLSDNRLCKVIGEIPGNMSSSYGDIFRFQTLTQGWPLPFRTNTLYARTNLSPISRLFRTYMFRKMTRWTKY